MIVDNQLYFELVNEQLAAGLKVRIILHGTSMMPTLHDGDTLTLTPCTQPPAVGDVVLFRCGPIHLLHRVKARDGQHLIMQGDNAFTTEKAEVSDVVATLTSVELRDGTVMTVGDERWTTVSRRALRRQKRRLCIVRWISSRGRKQLRPWYFVLLAILMWAPLNGLGIPLDNFILGLRLDHLLHASVYVLCPMFLWDLFWRRGLDRQIGYTWVSAVAVGLLTEGVQYLLPYRGFDINDMIANTLGVTLGWLVFLYASHRLKAKESQKKKKKIATER